MAILLAFACKGKPGKEPGQGQVKDSAVLVSGRVLNDDSSRWFADRIQGPYKEHGIFRFRNIVVSVQTFSYEDPNDGFEAYMETNFLILRDPAKKVADTLSLETEDGDMEDVKIEDMSDSLKFKSLVLKLSTTGSSDMPIDEFVEYNDGRLRRLCMLIYCWDIWRKDENTLIAIINGRDEVLAYQYLYPVVINLKDNSVTGEMPDTQSIRHPTITLEPITVYRKNGEQLSQPLQVKTGTTIVVDTFFRKTDRVRMLLPDSTPVYIMRDDLSRKVESNTAG